MLFAETQEFYQAAFRSVQSLRSGILHGAYAQFGRRYSQGTSNRREYFHTIKFALSTETSDMIM